MTSDVDLIIRYCRKLFKGSEDCVDIMSKIENEDKNIKLKVKCHSFFYDVTISPYSLLRLKKMGMIQMSTQAIITSFGLFGVELEFIFSEKIRKQSVWRFVQTEEFFQHLLKECRIKKVFCSDKFLLYAINKFSFVFKNYPFYYYENGNCKIATWSFLYKKTAEYIQNDFNSILEKAIKLNTIRDKVLKKGVIQLPNGKFIKKTKTRELNIEPDKAYVIKCLFKPEIKAMTNKEKSIIVDYFLGLSDKGKDVIEKHGITKLDLEKIRQLNK